MIADCRVCKRSYWRYRKDSPPLDSVRKRVKTFMEYLLNQEFHRNRIGSGQTCGITG